jgi:hypothetical protein
VARHGDQPDSNRFIALLRGLFSRTDPDEERKRWLLERGRIADGVVIDMMQKGRSITEKDIDLGAPCLILYRYTISSVEYESSQVLSPAQMAHLQDYRVGLRVGVRYDPRRPINSLME